MNDIYKHLYMSVNIYSQPNDFCKYFKIHVHAYVLYIPTKNYV